MPLLVLFDVDGTLFLTHDAAFRPGPAGDAGSALRRRPSRGRASSASPIPVRPRIKIAASSSTTQASTITPSTSGLRALVPGVRRALPRAARPRGHEQLGAAPGRCRALAPASGRAPSRALDWESRADGPGPDEAARARRLLSGGAGRVRLRLGIAGRAARPGAERAGGWPAAETVAVGDTARDVEARPRDRDSLDRRPPPRVPTTAFRVRTPSATASTRRPSRLLAWAGLAGGPGLDSVHGAGARASGRFRASARAAPAADRLRSIR